MKKPAAEQKITFEEKKSRFLAYSFLVSSQENIRGHLEALKAENKDARHILYAYRLRSGIEGAEEDQEPVSSMHKILSLMQKKDIAGTLLVIVRYFGGTLLGAGNLDRIYFRLGTSLIKDENLAEEVSMVSLTLLIRASYLSALEKKTAELNGKILAKEYLGAQVEVKLEVPSSSEREIISYGTLKR
jgi:putative IMPACT (imprinted ancient) family translation regulator